MEEGKRNGLAQLEAILSTSRWIDLSPMLENDMPRWPTHPPFVSNPTVTHGHDGYYCQTIFMPEHAGAHVDSPYHIHENLSERTIEKYPVDYLVRPCKVIHMEQRDLQPGEMLTAEDILAWEKSSGKGIRTGDIVLVNFGWIQRHWRSDKDWQWYALNAPGFAESAADLFLSRKIRALGSDTIACGTALKDGKPVTGAPPPNNCWIHNMLLPKDILLIECLANMEQLPDECYFMALPLRIKSGSGSPIRAVALVP
jgi:arylformamidase